ncbi:MAG: trypsin-like peptidase domain-containing protein [Myxococcota bacterium]
MRLLMFVCAVWSAFLSTARAEDDVEKTWQATLERVVPAVVAIRVTGTRDFDTEDARSTVGTGFVIDAENGWILTNRHMVHAGPVVAEAIFENSEEVDLTPVYRDPVHDFGFYRFDPKQIRHMELTELKLDPEGARVGVDIRVIGNDAGEKISILDSTLARVDRNAPDYGPNTFNDFNTFYIQAASNTSGGSSGSPVVDIRGVVIALNAGGSTRAASSFYLPLYRVVRAFEYIRRGEPVPRGTLQTRFEYEYFGELERLGLKPETETQIRKAFKRQDGGLVVRQVLPQGPADGALLPGDVLLKVDGEWVVDFVTLESHIDDAVGKKLVLTVQRGGRQLDVDVEVGDLHAITPDEYLEVGRAVLTPLSYMQARNHDLPVRGVYVSVGGYSFSTAGIPAGAVLLQIDGQDVSTLAEAEAAIAKRADGDRMRVRFFTIVDDVHPYEAVVVVDRRWFTMQRCKRDDSTGTWPCVASPEPPAESSDVPAQSLIVPVAEKPASKVVSALVRVDFDIPYPTAGVKDLNYVGVGAVVDAAKGLVLVDRDTVPVRLGDLMLTFAGAVRVPGEVVFMHPMHDFAIIRYDTAALGDVPVGEIELLDVPLEKGDKVWLVGLDRQSALVNLPTHIQSAEPLELGVSGTPRFRDANVNAYTTEDAESTLGGVLTDKKGRVVASWASFIDQAAEDRQFRGLPVMYTKPVVDALRAGQTVDAVTIMGADLERLTLDAARDRGLSDARIRQILRADPSTRTMSEVTRIHGTAPAREALRNTDIVLEVNGEPFTSITQVEKADGPMTLTVLRDREEKTVTFDPLRVGATGVDRVVSWAGLIVHEPHYEVAAQRGIDPEGVYIAWLWYGSPGARYQIRPTRRILKVDDTPTPDLDAFLAAVRGLSDREAVRLTMKGLNGAEQVQTLKMDLQYWPTQVFEVQEGRWERVQVEGTE